MLYIVVLCVQDHLHKRRPYDIESSRIWILRKAVAETSLCSNPEDGLESLVTQYQEDLNKVLDSIAHVQTIFCWTSPSSLDQ